MVKIIPQQILEIAVDYNNKDIAIKLNRKVPCIKEHITGIYKHWDVRNRTELIIKYYNLHNCGCMRRR